ncbi:ATP-grasp ribosomal peptide maturase [Streptacidiphilus sp. MAP12-20]|uniref:ATP-grasp ribosomal peptide maturase n=1 Tax=Streptacidiphilus sp. MAP12-20 TaxID=3156299 RepID=UPI00351365A1
MAAVPGGRVLVVAENLDPAADMVVAELNARRVPVVRFDVADFPQHITLAADYGAEGWAGVLEHAGRTVRLDDVRSIYWHRPGRPHVDEAIPDAYRVWARDQADAALLNLLAALPVRWLNNPHTDRPASHKPQQLALASRCGLTVPRTLVTNVPEAARKWAADLGAPIICKPVLGGRLDDPGERRRMVPAHQVDPNSLDDSVKLTAHLFQEKIPKDFEVRLTVVGCELFAATIHAGSVQAEQDWRSDYPNLSYGTTSVPETVARGVRGYCTWSGLAFGAFDFAVTPAGEWVFFECNPSGTWAWVEQRTGLPIAAAHATYLQGADA